MRASEFAQYCIFNYELFTALIVILWVTEQLCLCILYTAVMPTQDHTCYFRVLSMLDFILWWTDREERHRRLQIPSFWHRKLYFPNSLNDTKVVIAEASEIKFHTFYYTVFFLSSLSILCRPTWNSSKPLVPKAWASKNGDITIPKWKLTFFFRLWLTQPHI